jgi:hypothetical protein
VCVCVCVGGGVINSRCRESHSPKLSDNSRVNTVVDTIVVISERRPRRRLENALRPHHHNEIHGQSNEPARDHEVSPCVNRYHNTHKKSCQLAIQQWVCRESVRVQRSEDCWRGLPHKRILQVEKRAKSDFLGCETEDQRTYLARQRSERVNSNA